MQSNYLIATDIGLRIDSVSDILEAIGQCYGKSGLLLTEEDVTREFFELQNGLAGELFQKCTNYQLPLALVVKDLSVYSPRIAELAFEHRNHRLIRFFDDIILAKTWLQNSTKL